jgi:arylsulfatase
MSLYAASIESVDKALGRVIGQLKAQGEFDNTLIFVLSDNGGNWEGGITGSTFGKSDPLTGTQLANMGQPSQQDDHMQVGGGWAHVENTPFRFYKHYTHEGGVRSPLVVSWPGHTAQPGGWTNQYAHVIDIVPTILQAAGAEHPTMYNGHPALPLEGMQLVDTISKGASPMDRQIGFEHETNRAWIEGDMKLVVRHEDGDQLELYNIKTDPSELSDLSAAQPAKLKEMVDKWNQWAKHVGVPADRLLKEP